MATVSIASRIASWREPLSPRLRRRRAMLSGLPTELLAGLLDDPSRLGTHLADPTSYDLRLAIDELRRRGVDACPPPDALLDLLTADDERQRVRGMLLFHAAYPACGAPPSGEAWSSGDSREAWQARVARIAGSADNQPLQRTGDGG